MAIDLGGLLKTLTEDYESTRVEKQKRYTEGKGILEGIVKQFGPGYLKGEEKQQLAAMEQGMVGRGLGGTTRPAAVGTGIKADIRDRATQARTGAMTNVAQFMAGFQDVSPDPSTLAHLATGGFSGMLSQQQLGLQAAMQREQLGLQREQFERDNPRPGTAGSDYDVFGRPKPGRGGVSGGGVSGSADGTTSGGGWQPSGMPSATGMGAATYGVGGGSGLNAPREYDPSMVGKSMWAQQGSEVFGDGGGREIPAQSTPSGMDAFLQDYTPQTGDYSSVEAGPGGGGGYEAWLKATGKGATASTIMQWERANKPYA